MCAVFAGADLVPILATKVAVLADAMFDVPVPAIGVERLARREGFAHIPVLANNVVGAPLSEVFVWMAAPRRRRHRIARETRRCGSRPNRRRQHGGPRSRLELAREGAEKLVNAGQRDVPCDGKRSVDVFESLHSR